MDIIESRMLLGFILRKNNEWQTLSRNNLDSTYPEDMMNLMRKALSLIDHLSSNKKDLHNRRQLELCESRLRRLAKYYVGTGRISSTWTYKRDQLRLMVE